jgi:putative transposase
MFQVESVSKLMMDVMRSYRNQGRFSVHAFVVMPDHVHVIMTPAPDVSLEKAVQFIKGGFSFRLKSKRDVWERSFNEVQIVNAEKFEACKRYIEENPARGRLVIAPGEYAYSSARENWVDPMPEHFFRG